MTGNIAILWPMIVQAFLTLSVYVVVLLRRKAAVGAGETTVAAFRLQASEPATSATAVRNLANQYELPVLFHVVCLALYATNGASWFAVAIAWLFSVSRVLHAIVHLGSNRLRQRVPLFVMGVAAVFLLWLILALHIANF